MNENKFFGRNTSIGKLDVNPAGASCESPEVKKRLDRISTNYDRIDAILSEMEAKIAVDEVLNPPKPKVSKSKKAKSSKPKSVPLSTAEPVESQATQDLGLTADAMAAKELLRDNELGTVSADPKKPR